MIHILIHILWILLIELCRADLMLPKSETWPVNLLSISILTKYQYWVYWYWYFLFWFSNTGKDTSYFKNVLKYWYYSILFIISISIFLKPFYLHACFLFVYFLHIITNTVPDPIFLGYIWTFVTNLAFSIRILKIYKQTSW